MKRLGPVGAALLLALAACQADAPREGAAGVTTRVDTVGRVVVVRNEGSPPEWSVEPLLSLGSEGGVGDGGPEEFGSVASVVADAEGSVYVADRQAREIRVFGADGGHLRTLGRKGRGPAEIGDLYSLAWLGDTLAVLDPRNARIGLFTPDGAWAGSWRWQPLTGHVRFLPAGDAEAYVQWVHAGEDGLEAYYVRYTAAGSADSVPVPHAQGLSSSLVRCDHPGGGGMSFFETPFAPRPIHAFAPGGRLAVVPGGAYRIAFLNAAGDTVRVVERAHAPVPVGDEEWEEGVRPFREFREKMPGARCQGEMARPAHRPAVRDLLFDGTGRMWVESAIPDGFAWDVFDGEGRLLGTFPAPPRQARTPPYVRGSRLYLVDADSLDVQYVRAYDVKESRAR